MAKKEANQRWPGVDSLRGISIIMVVIYHYTSRFDFSYLFFSHGQSFYFPGWIGVDIFFIVSGFCIALTLERTDTGTGLQAAGG